MPHPTPTPDTGAAAGGALPYGTTRLTIAGREFLDVPVVVHRGLSVVIRSRYVLDGKRVAPRAYNAAMLDALAAQVPA